MLDRLLRLIDRAIELLGKAAALAILGMIAVMVFEMVARGVFGQSMPWAAEVTSWLLVAMVFLGGPWALARGNFVRVDAIYERFTPMTKALIDTFVSTALFVLFCGVLIKFGGDFAMKSFAMGERSATGGWGGPVWLPKMLMPLGAGLLAIGWIAHLLHAWRGDKEPSHEEGL
ncbi:TRAP transporter small permease subunit [Afifella pfennigii]|uniref:TRAP transporter small permease subunit n=1 Tax=Afifella pfennigii TaxID=209897 RepID=UPI00047B1290|nr:TRAP transporter small permease subunit [Afifella pfennigii]